MTYNELQKKAKTLGINGFGVKREELKQKIVEKENTETSGEVVLAEKENKVKDNIALEIPTLNKGLPRKKLDPKKKYEENFISFEMVERFLDMGYIPSELPPDAGYSLNEAGINHVLKDTRAGKLVYVTKEIKDDVASSHKKTESDKKESQEKQETQLNNAG